MLNEFKLIGNMGKEPITWVSKQGRKFTYISLATNESWKDKTTGEWKEKTAWHDIFVSGDYLLAKAEKVAAGSKLLIEGKIAYKIKVEGDVKKKEVVLNATRMTIIHNKKTTHQVTHETQTNTASAEVNDDLPF